MSIFKKVLVGIRNSTEKMVTEIERQELFKELLEKATLGFLGNKLRTVQTKLGERQFLDMGRAVNFSLLTNDDHIVLCKQERATIPTVEFGCFGGYVDKGETITQAMAREGWEETNVEFTEKDITILYEDLNPSAGYTNEMNSLAIINVPMSSTEILDVLKCNDVAEGIDFEVMSIKDFKELKVKLLKLEFVRQHIINR